MTKCPKCKGNTFEEQADEVDIGVGVQRHLTGGDCTICGPMSVCPECGEWDWKTPAHITWCPDLKRDMKRITEEPRAVANLADDAMEKKLP